MLLCRFPSQQNKRDPPPPFDKWPLRTVSKEWCYPIKAGFSPTAVVAPIKHGHRSSESWSALAQSLRHLFTPCHVTLEWGNIFPAFSFGKYCFLASFGGGRGKGEKKAPYKLETYKLLRYSLKVLAWTLLTLNSQIWRHCAGVSFHLRQKVNRTKEKQSLSVIKTFARTEKTCSWTSDYNKAPTPETPSINVN